MEKCSPEDQREHMVPFIGRCIESNFEKVQIEALKHVEHCALENLINYIEFKTNLLPKIEQVCKKTNNSNVRLNGKFKKNFGYI